ncbi:MAG TPA: GNAT family protein [Candidatus Dormibacteraeota bacterium]|nr:GNAT family protein [Candidatus Dormibacteraeota bacterium]
MTIRGRAVELSPIDPAKHGQALWEELAQPAQERLWRYLPDGPFSDEGAFLAQLERLARSENRLFLAILDLATGRAQGWAALLRVEPEHRCLELGYILFTPRLQRTRGATEALFLISRHVFEELGYRRLEWKCDSLNLPSRRAAERLGFTFEGIFRQHMIVKGRSRDTAWYALLDGEWPARKARLERWLAPTNFDPAGNQLLALSDLPR